MCGVMAIRFVAKLENGKVRLPRQQGLEELAQRGYGVYQEDGSLLLSPCEALYLLERKRIKVVNEEKLDFQSLLSRLASQRGQGLWAKYMIYRDLRRRGYVVREGVGLGLDFRVYEKGEYGKKPAKYLVYGILEGLPIPIKKITQLLSHTQSLKKRLILAVVDRRGEIVYYTVSTLNI